MNVVELFVVLAACACLGFVGSLVSHRYGWIAGAAPATIFLLIMAFFTWRDLIIQMRDQWKRRRVGR